MSSNVRIEPLTRIEGHMKVETVKSGGHVTEAKISGQMYRGFEKFLLNRHPVDAARIAQRVCGVCHEAHGIASIMALEELYGADTPPNGLLLRDLILGMHLIGDHLLHFYTLSLPDYADFTKILNYKGTDKKTNALKDWVVQTKPQFVLKRNEGNLISSTQTNLRLITNYFEALQIRSKTAGGIAIIGAKAPFTHAVLPGGVTTDITADKLLNYYQVLQQTESFVRNSYLPDVLDVASRYKEYFDIGVAHNNFFANQTFTTEKKPLFHGGVSIRGKRHDFDYNEVRESFERSYYDDAGNPMPEKEGAYSWTKSPRFMGEPLEVGPLARMIINDDAGFKDIMKSLGQSELKSSVMARHVARASETLLLIDHMYALLDAYSLGETTIDHIDMSKPVTGKGLGLSIAARGGLIHYIEADDGKISKYNMVVPSTWNFGPAAEGKLGVCEQSLIGTPIAYSDENSIEVGRVIRSYDPCTACSVH